MAKEIWRLQSPGKEAQHCLGAWAEMIWKFQYFSFLLWLFCNQHLQRATQLFETQFTGAKRRVIKTNPNTRWFGDLRESKDSHLYCEVKTTFITWKSLATHGLVSQGSRDCTGMSHCSSLSGAASTPETHPHPPVCHCPFPILSMGQMQTSFYSDPGQFPVCCLLCADFSLCRYLFPSCWMRGQGCWRSHWEERQEQLNFCIKKKLKR